MGKQHPLSKEELGDEMLNEARDLVTSEVKFMIGKGDLSVIEERIDFARDMKVGLNSKSCIQKIIHTRKYYRVAKGVHRDAKFISDRAHDRARFQYQPCTSSKTEDIYRIARSLYRCWHSYREPFPSSHTQDQWVVEAWNVACHKTDAHPNSLRQDEEIKCDSMELLTDMKTKIKHAVDYAYKFDTGRSSDSISRNVTRAQALLAETAFIYRDFDIGKRPRFIYQHPIIQEVVNLTWFKNTDDVGIVFHYEFNPLPFEVMALAVTMIECCINEWSTGTYTESNWKEERYKDNYSSHLNSLMDLDTHGLQHEGRDLLQQIRRDLLWDARVHAGAPANPATPPGSGRFTMDALDAAILDGPPARLGSNSNRSQRSLVSSNRVSSL